MTFTQTLERITSLSVSIKLLLLLSMVTLQLLTILLLLYEKRDTMENSMIPRLCGGVFFGLLTQLKYSNNSLDYKNVTYDNVTDPILMAELIYVVTKSMPNYKKSGFAKDVSKYRNCNYNGGERPIK